MKEIQLCRGYDGWYVVCLPLSIKPKKMGQTWVQLDRNGKNRILDLGPTLAKALELPKLKPGEGPRRVKFTAEFVD